MVARALQNTFWLEESEGERNEEEEDEFDALANVPIPANMQEEEFRRWSRRSRWRKSSLAMVTRSWRRRRTTGRRRETQSVKSQLE